MASSPVGMCNKGKEILKAKFETFYKVDLLKEIYRIYS